MFLAVHSQPCPHVVVSSGVYRKKAELLRGGLHGPSSCQWTERVKSPLRLGGARFASFLTCRALQSLTQKERATRETCKDRHECQLDHGYIMELIHSPVCQCPQVGASRALESPHSLRVLSVLGLLAVPGVSGAPGPNLVGVSGSPMSKSPESPASPRSPALWSVSPVPRVQVWCLPSSRVATGLRSAQCARSPDCIWGPWVRAWLQSVSLGPRQVWSVSPHLLRLLSLLRLLGLVGVSGALGPSLGAV